jgi:hypothetical protein
MATTYKTDLIPPDSIDAYKAAHPIGKQIVLPDVNSPGKSIAYTVQEVQIADAPSNPRTGDPVKLVTLVLKN